MEIPRRWIWILIILIIENGYVFREKLVKTRSDFQKVDSHSIKAVFIRRRFKLKSRLSIRVLVHFAEFIAALCVREILGKLDSHQHQKPSTHSAPLLPRTTANSGEERWIRTNEKLREMR
jgi:hypothetical protein